jgi:hypothetical protein
MPLTCKRCCKAGFADCGLFAITNAIAIASGIYPGAIIFDQSQMHQHLKKCIERKEITMFPHEVKKQPCQIRERSTMINNIDHCNIDHCNNILIIILRSFSIMLGLKQTNA